MIIIKHRGDLKKTSKFLDNAKNLRIRDILERYAKIGVEALSSATPVDSGETSRSWDYDIRVTRGKYSINWTNSNIVDGVPVAILLQYGHGTGSGGYVEGRDFINPAVAPIIDKIIEDIEKEVSRL